MIDKRYYVNVADLMKQVLPRPTPKPKMDIPIVSVEVGLWSHVTWVQIQNFNTVNVGTVLFQDYS